MTSQPRETATEPSDAPPLEESRGPRKVLANYGRRGDRVKVVEDVKEDRQRDRLLPRPWREGPPPPLCAYRVPATVGLDGGLPLPQAYGVGTGTDPLHSLMLAILVREPHDTPDAGLPRAIELTGWKSEHQPGFLPTVTLVGGKHENWEPIGPDDTLDPHTALIWMLRHPDARIRAAAQMSLGDAP